MKTEVVIIALATSVLLVTNVQAGAASPGALGGQALHGLEVTALTGEQTGASQSGACQGEERILLAGKKSSSGKGKKHESGDAAPAKRSTEGKAKDSKPESKKADSSVPAEPVIGESEKRRDSGLPSPEESAGAELRRTRSSFSGNASWYGIPFHGRKTASGETFNMYGLSAAHLHLPLPSKALVEDPRTGNAVIVKVNDRGPYVKTRVMDLSRGAARKLGTLSRGVAFVDITVLDAKPFIRKPQ